MADTPDKSESAVLGPDTGAVPVPVPVAAPVPLETAVEAPAPIPTIEKPAVAPQETSAEATTADAAPAVAPKDDNAITDSTADNQLSAPAAESASAPAQAEPSQGTDTVMGEPANPEAAVETNQQETSTNQDIETDGPTNEGAESSQANSSAMETDPEASAAPAADASADPYTEQDEGYKGTELVSSVPAPSEKSAAEAKSNNAKPSAETTGEGQSVGSLTKAAPVANANPSGKGNNNHHPHHNNNNYSRPYQRGGRGGFNNRYGYQNNSRNFNNPRPFNNNNNNNGPNHHNNNNNNNMNNGPNHQNNNYNNNNNFNNNNSGNNGNFYNNNNNSGGNNHHGGPGPIRRGGFRGKAPLNLIVKHDHTLGCCCILRYLLVIGRISSRPFVKTRHHLALWDPKGLVQLALNSGTDSFL